MAAGSISHNADRFQEWRDSLLLREFLNVRPIEHKEKPGQPKPAKHETAPIDDDASALDYLAEVAARNHPTSDFFRFAIFLLSGGIACNDDRNGRFMASIGFDPEECDLPRAAEALRDAGA
jgi:hypothetical protein